MRRAMVLSGAVVCLLTSAPAEASAKRCKAVFVDAGNLTIYDGSIKASRGIDCATARRAVGAFARRRVRDFDGCAVPSANGGVCIISGFQCWTRGGRGTCRSARHFSRSITFRELQESLA